MVDSQLLVNEQLSKSQWASEEIAHGARQPQPQKPRPATDGAEATDRKRRERLKDLDVSERDGGVVKGGIPKQPDSLTTTSSHGMSANAETTSTSGAAGTAGRSADLRGRPRRRSSAPMKCDRVVGYIDALGQTRGSIGSKDRSDAVVDLDVRRVRQTRLRRSPETRWVSRSPDARPSRRAMRRTSSSTFTTSKTFRLLTTRRRLLRLAILDLGPARALRQLQRERGAVGARGLRRGRAVIPGAVLRQCRAWKRGRARQLLVHGVQPVTRGRGSRSSDGLEVRRFARHGSGACQTR